MIESALANFKTPEWLRLGNALKSVEGNLIKALKYNKFTLEDVMGLYIIQTVIKDKRIWTVCMGNYTVNFQLDKNDTYQYNEDVVSYDDICRAVQLPIRCKICEEYEKLENIYFNKDG